MVLVISREEEQYGRTNYQTHAHSNPTPLSALSLRVAGLSCLCLPSFISLVTVSSKNLWLYTVQPKAQRHELFKHQTEPDRHKGSYSLKPVDSNFLADPDQQILNTLTEHRLAHHLSAELAQGNRLFPLPSASLPPPMKWAWLPPRNGFSKKTQGRGSSVHPHLAACSLPKAGLLKCNESVLGCEKEESS